VDENDKFCGEYVHEEKNNKIVARYPMLFIKEIIPQRPESDPKAMRTKEMYLKEHPCGKCKNFLVTRYIRYGRLTPWQPYCWNKKSGQGMALEENKRLPHDLCPLARKENKTLVRN